jgi:glycerophosphoryl diester phosphodiesterase family protein
MDNSGGFTAPPPPPPPPPPGGEGGAGGSLPARGLGDILSAAWQIYTKNAASLLLIVAVVVVPLSFIGALVSGVVFNEDETVRAGVVSGNRSAVVGLFVGLILALIGLVIVFVLQAAILRGAAQATIGDPVDVEASYRWGLRRFPSVLLLAILVGITVLVGFILLIIPGLIFIVMFSVAIPVLVIENRKGTEAMSRSWNLVKGHFWHVVLVLIVTALITGLVSGIVGAIGGHNWFIAWIFDAVAQIITAPFTALVSVLLYLDLRARSEALTAEQLRAELAATA